MTSDARVLDALNPEITPLSSERATAAARVRFAPSPTGFQRIGGGGAALFVWLFARHTAGQFLLRIEDTGASRAVPGAVEAILEGFRWLGMDWDEGPIVGGPVGPDFQTQRHDVYARVVAQLIATPVADRRALARPHYLHTLHRGDRAARMHPGTAT